MNKSVVDLLRSGKLGGIGVGDSISNLHGAFGESEDSYISGGYKIYKYGSLEITALDEEIVMLSINVLGSDLSLPKVCDPSPLFYGNTVEEIVEDLEANDVGWHLCKEYNTDQDICIVTESGALIYYQLPAKELDKILISRLEDSKYTYQ